MATVTFPNSYLSTASQPWGRIVEKQLVDLSLLVNSNEINNAARDKQLLASLNRVNAAAISAQNAIDGVLSVEEAVYYPGTTEIDGGNIRANTIAANKISAGELIGFTIKTAPVGYRRSELSGTDIRFYDEGGNYTGNITGSGADRASAVQMISSSATGIYAYNGGADLVGPGTMISAGYSGSGTAYISSVNGVAISANSGFAVLNINSSNLISNSSVTDIKSTAVNAQGIYDATSSLAYNMHIQGSANNYRIYRSTFTSTRALKRDIRPLVFDKDAYIDISPVVFKYVDGVLREEEKDWDIVGFIAEDFVDAGLGEHLVTQPQDENDHISLRYDKMYMFLHSVVKSQNETIKNLTTRLESLENK